MDNPTIAITSIALGISTVAQATLHHRSAVQSALRAGGKTPVPQEISRAELDTPVKPIHAAPLQFLRCAFVTRIGWEVLFTQPIQEAAISMEKQVFQDRRLGPVGRKAGTGAEVRQLRLPPPASLLVPSSFLPC